MIKIENNAIIDVNCEDSDLRDICSEIWYRNDAGVVVPRKWTILAAENLLRTVQNAERDYMLNDKNVDGCYLYRLRFLTLFSNGILSIAFDANLDTVISDEEILKDIEDLSRLSHRFAVKNSNTNLYRNFARIDISDEVVEASAFILQWRLWKVYLKNGNWCLAFDAGNGNYDRMSKDNSYNLFVSFI